MHELATSLLEREAYRMLGELEKREPALVAWIWRFVRSNTSVPGGFGIEALIPALTPYLHEKRVLPPISEITVRRVVNERFPDGAIGRETFRRMLTDAYARRWQATMDRDLLMDSLQSLTGRRKLGATSISRFATVLCLAINEMERLENKCLTHHPE